MGGYERRQSMQVTNWANEEILSFCFLEDEVFRDIIFDPYNRFKLCVSGVNLIRIYSLQNCMLVLKEECRLKDTEILCLVYNSSMFGKDIESDIITGNSRGDIGLYICDKYIVSKEKTHAAAINCLRIAELFKYKTVLVSGGRDGFIKIWDIKFNETSRKSMR